MNRQSPTIRKGRKFDQVLEGARSVFLEDGFEGASVDSIARAAAVSKATLYSYFPDKQHIFLAVVNAECARQSQEAIDKIDQNAPPSQVLGQAGRHFLRFLTSDFGKQMFRICVAESGRFPEIGREFYRSGPERMQAEVSAYLDAARARGQLRIEDTLLAAQQFSELCKADIWLRLIFGVSPAPQSEDIDRIVDSAVKLFLARYGTGG